MRSVLDTARGTPSSVNSLLLASCTEAGVYTGSGRAEADEKQEEGEIRLRTNKATRREERIGKHRCCQHTKIRRLEGDKQMAFLYHRLFCFPIMKCLTSGRGTVEGLCVRLPKPHTHACDGLPDAASELLHCHARQAAAGPWRPRTPSLPGASPYCT